MYEPVHVLSGKSTRQHRNVFIWCTASHKLALGWRVDNNSSITVSTAYRWITDGVLGQYRTPILKEAERFTLFPVKVRPIASRYFVHKNGDGLSRESQDIIAPGDYGLYTIGDPRLYFFFKPVLSYSDTERAVKGDNSLLSVKASLTPPLIQQALDRDRQCIFSDFMPSCDFDGLVTTWIYPPFLGYELSDDPWLESKYYQYTDACGLSECMVVENVVSGRQDIVTLFWENKLGVDVEMRILPFKQFAVVSMTHRIIIASSYSRDRKALLTHPYSCVIIFERLTSHI